MGGSSSQSNHPAPHTSPPPPRQEHGRKPLLKAPELAPQANPGNALAAALRASAAQQEATRAALREAQALNKTYQDEVRLY